MILKRRVYRSRRRERRWRKDRKEHGGRRGEQEDR